MKYLVLVCAVVPLVGCDTKSVPDDEPQNVESMASGEKAELLKKVTTELLEVESQPVEVEPVFELPKPEGWTMSELRALRAEDQGFSVAYKHASGPTVTLYQSKRGHDEIPKELTSEIVLGEMKSACNGIEQMGQLQQIDARKTDDQVTKLGESNTEALWTRYELSKDQIKRRSDVFVWSHNNALIKLRVSWYSGEAEEERVFKELLTALGTACM